MDEEDVHYINEHTWWVKVHPRKAGNLYYLVHKVYNGEKTINYYLHRLIMGLPPASDTDLIVDHINHNTLDNRKENLRIVTRKENSRNGRRRPNNTTGYTGVSIPAKSKILYYNVWICVDYKSIFIGRYFNLEQAAMAYDVSALKYFGKYASLNFPDKDYASMDTDRILYSGTVPNLKTSIPKKELVRVKKVRGLQKNNTSGITRVAFDVTRNKWTAQGRIHLLDGTSKPVRIGRYNTKEEAIIARNNLIEENRTTDALRVKNAQINAYKED